MEFLGGLSLLVFIAIVAVGVLCVLAILMPLFVYKIWFETAVTAREIKKQNTLTRQLIRAYGHEPEA
jgi:uncharacterized membrane protein affecting hemolysin expression